MCPFFAKQSLDFSEVPVFASGRAERFQMPPPGTAPRLSGRIVGNPLGSNSDCVPYGASTSICKHGRYLRN